jgi:hypothetical protein
MPPTQRSRILLWTAAGLLLLLLAYGFVRFFLSQIGHGRPADLAAVVAAAPAGFEVLDRGNLPPARAASELASLLAARPGRVGIHFSTPDGTLYWLADPAADTLEERAAGAAGTRLATIWSGQIRRRLDWAASHDGDLSPPGLPPPERKNLYH